MSTRSYNRVILIGNLTRDPELRYTASGTAVASFGIATNRNYVDSSGKDVESTEFTNIVAWAKLAEICSKLLRKGMKVFIEGRLQTNSWDDKDTGKRMYRTEVVAMEMIILSPSRSIVDRGEYGEMGQDVNVNNLDVDVADDVDSGKSSKKEVSNDDKSKDVSVSAEVEKTDDTSEVKAAEARADSDKGKEGEEKVDSDGDAASDDDDDDNATPF